ncbi:beta-methylmalyl-CoA/L-malyl-CoA lyase [Desulfacinum hydrothermale DSM 13146]|uniref:Beta-methylmalyl-CoA/L-malyl-CoA lyase n=1 Tax=Desulfacinum hydrothermale DSM 13146 TaxID=1121390 RepID=A0A1W1XUQ3_9BACT|nr:CoA ester lyase [Desulfacinum hydrothermale]SMC27248.1 beta-methylmalyl-CoA/L-malyl-CoA lyase [Desulfacinum hydrothermale DSM 13146]
MERPVRLRRSLLSVPANRERMVQKALGLPADVVMLDLEDSVPVEEKAAARQAVVEALRLGDWGGKVRAYRINDMGTPFAYRDVIDVVEAAGDLVDVIVVPKVNDPAEIKALDYLLTQIEWAMGVHKRIGLEASIETAQGMARVHTIAGSSPRLEALVFGVADYGASLGMPSGGVSGHGDGEGDYPGHRWHYPLSRMVMAAKAAGLAAMDAPYGDFKDEAGLGRSCALSRALGYDGKWAIHPAQLETINAAFSPEEEEVQRALRIVEAYESARAKGEGTLALDGKMVDAASVRLAQVTVAAWRRIREQQKETTDSE